MQVASRSLRAAAGRLCGQSIRSLSSTIPPSSTSSASGSAAKGSGDDGTGKTHFGFRDVDVDDKEQLVGRVFHSVAEQYDVMNDLMSGTLHRVWKDQFVAELLPICGAGYGARTIDVAGGTGDIAFRIVRESNAMSPSDPPVHVTVCDINSSMLGVGRERAIEKGLYTPGSAQQQLDFIEGNAEKLPQFEDNSFDAYTIAFGIRNVTHIDRALREAHRILKPGGRFMCLEFSHVANPVMKAIYEQYSFHAIPAIGQFIANDRDAYQYLVESIRKFPEQRAFERMIREAGFSNVTHENFTCGIVAMHSGYKL